MSLLTLLVATTMLSAPESGDDAPLTPAEQSAIVEKIIPSIVRVECTLQYDKGEAPEAMGVGERCPNCGSYHGQEVESLIQQERPLEMAGFLIGPTRAVCPDPQVHPRFVKEIVVRFGDQRVGARPVGFCDAQNAVFLELSKPLEDAVALSFDVGRDGPYLAVTCARTNGAWTASVQPFSKGISITEDHDRFCAATANAVVVDKKGTPVTLCMNPRLPVDDSWKAVPDTWKSLSAQDRAALVQKTEAAANQCLLHVLLRLRSPKTSGGSSPWSYRYGRDDEDSPERRVVGVLVDRETVLILASLSPRVTARLQRIQVYPPQGEPIGARFSHTLKEYGCLIAKLERPLDGPAVLRTDAILKARDTLLASAAVVIRGEKRVIYCDHCRVPAFDVGWKGQVFPEMRGSSSPVFIFDREARLWALPVSRRPKLSVRDEWSSEYSMTTALVYLADAIKDPGRHCDPNNVPQSEEDENRLAWLGVELQALDADLARINKVSDLTRDGQAGALVAHVYPDSPAAKAGIEAGFVLLRLHVPGHPKPLEIQLDHERYGFMGGFSWEEFENMPAEYLSQLPAPWPSADNTLNRTLTELGEGQQFSAEFARNGEVVMKDFEVVMGPRTFESASRYKSDALGLTVRNVTYEVRRHLQLGSDDPGVIVSKTEQGGKAAVAGILPYEIITHVNAKPVADVKEFEASLLGGGDDLRLSVKRMTKGREVKVRMTGPAETGPASALRQRLGRLWPTTASRPGGE